MGEFNLLPCLSGLGRKRIKPNLQSAYRERLHYPLACHKHYV